MFGFGWRSVSNGATRHRQARSDRGAEAIPVRVRASGLDPRDACRCCGRIRRACRRAARRDRSGNVLSTAGRWRKSRLLDADQRRRECQSQLRRSALPLRRSSVPRTVAITERCSGRPMFRASRSRSAVAESSPMSTCTSPSAPRSTSSMRCAEKSRRRRFSLRSACAERRGREVDGDVALGLHAEQRRQPTGLDGMAGEAAQHCPIAIDAADRCVAWDAHARCAPSSSPSLTIERNGSSLSRSGSDPERCEAIRLRAHMPTSSAAAVVARGARRTPVRVCRFPSRICSVQCECIAASSCWCGPHRAAALARSGRARGRAAASVCSSVWHIRANAAAGCGFARRIECVDVEIGRGEHRHHRCRKLDTVVECPESRRRQERCAAREHGAASASRPAMWRATRCRSGAQDGGARSRPGPISSSPTRRCAFSAVTTRIVLGDVADQLSAEVGHRLG